MKAINKTKEILESDSFQLFEEECLEFFEKWQYFEPASTEHEDRFELDKEAYKKTFFEGPHILSIEYNETDLVKLLLTNLQKVKHPILISYREFLKNKLSAPQQTETKTDNLKAELGKYGFFELPMVKQLSEPSKQNLIEKISTNKMPYGIAMFDFLGFCEYLDREQGTKYKANKILSRLYNAKAKDGTSAKHNRRSLFKPLSRYKACEYKETVKNDYQNLK